MKRNYPFKKFLLVCAAVTAVFGISAAIILLRARPMIYQTAVSNAESLSLKLTDMAVAEVLDGERISYGDIVKLTADDAGAVKSLEIDPREINLLKTEISSKVSEPRNAAARNGHRRRLYQRSRSETAFSDADNGNGIC